MGNAIEKIVIRQLEDAGVQVIEQQRAFDWPEYQITGSIDGKILANGKAIPFDVKSCSQWVFKSINTIDDLIKSKYLHLRKYPVQLNTYMLLDNVDEGIFFFKDKSSGQLKEIWMQFDYESFEYNFLSVLCGYFLKILCFFRRTDYETVYQNALKESLDVTGNPDAHRGKEGRRYRDYGY